MAFLEERTAAAKVWQSDCETSPVGNRVLLWARLTLTFCIQHLRDVQVFLCHLKGSVQVADGVILDGHKWAEVKGPLRAEVLGSGAGVSEAYLAQFGIVDEVGAVSVDEGTEGQAILPAAQKEGAGQAQVQAEALSYACPRSTPSGQPPL